MQPMARTPLQTEVLLHLRILRTDTTTTQETQTTESADTQRTESTESTPENTTGPTGNVEGYYASIGIRYEASYEGLKDMIAYVNKFKDRTTIAQFSASFDNSTGKLNGRYDTQYVLS